MSEAAKKRSLKWPVCSLVIAALLGGIGWWGYTEIRSARPPAAVEAPAAPGPRGETAPARPGDYRAALPVYFLAGFAAVMAVLLGTILYLWWSLKDLEGGRRYGEEEEGEGPEG